MLPHQVVAVAIRLFVLCFGVSALRMLPTLLMVGTGNTSARVYGLFVFAIMAIISVILWFFPRSVAGRLVSSSAEPGPAAAPDTWLAMGCALVGLWILASVVPALIRDAFLLNLESSMDVDNSTTKSWVLYNFLEVAIGLWLVFGAAGFRRVFWWARSAGVSEPPVT